MSRSGGVVAALLVGLCGCTNDYGAILPAGGAGAGTQSSASAGPGGAGASSSVASGGAGGAGASTATTVTSSAATGGAATGGSGGSTCALSALQDTFNGNTVGAEWTAVQEDGGQVKVHGGMLEVHPSMVSWSRAEVVSKATFDLRECAMVTKRAKTFHPDAHAASYMKALVDPGGTWLRIGVAGSEIDFEVNDDGNELANATLPFDPTVHVYWRIREEGGQVLFDTSPDGSAWTNHLIAATPDFASAIVANLGASSHDSPPVDPGEATFESFNP